MTKPPETGQEPTDKVLGVEALVERAATVVVFLVEREGKEYILLLHKESKSRNDWEVPGGTVEKEETTKDTIIREIFEEAGLSIKDYELSSISTLSEHLGLFMNTEDKTIQTKVLLSYLLAQSIEELTQNVAIGEEHSEYILIQNPTTHEQNYREMHTSFVNQLRNQELRLAHVQGNVWQVQAQNLDKQENNNERTLRLSEVTALALLDFANWDLGRGF